MKTIRKTGATAFETVIQAQRLENEQERFRSKSSTVPRALTRIGP